MRGLARLDLNRGNVLDMTTPKETTTMTNIAPREVDYVRTQPFPSGQCHTEARMPSGGLYVRCTLPLDHDGICPPVQRLRDELAALEFPIYPLAERHHEAVIYERHVDALETATQLVQMVDTMRTDAVAAALAAGLTVDQVALALTMSRGRVEREFRREIAIATANTCKGKPTGHKWDTAGVCTVCGDAPFAGLPT